MFLSPIGPPADVSALALALFGKATLPDGKVITSTSGFNASRGGTCDPRDRSNCHNAWDVAMASGTALQAPYGATVSSAGDTGGSCGVTAVFDGPFGIRTRYCHMLDVAVNEGQQVSKGEYIGRSNNTGNTTGPHWHGQYAFCNGADCGPLRDPRLLLAMSELAGWAILIAAGLAVAGVFLTGAFE